MKIRARPIDDHDRRKIAHAKAIHGLWSELRKRKNVGRFDPFAEQRTEAADRRQVDRSLVTEDLDDLAVELTLANDSLRTGAEETRQVLDEPLRRRGSRRADDLAWLRGRRSDGVQQAVPEVDGQLVAGRGEIEQALCGRVADGE